MQQIESIEKNEIMPSVAPLVKISKAFGVRLGTFLDDCDNDGPVICRNHEKCDSMSFSTSNNKSRSSLNFYSLAGQKSGRHMEPFIVEIKSSEERNFIMSSHEGEEFIFVLDGVIEITYGEKNLILEAGDSIYYDSIIAHHVHAVDETNAKILAVVYSPI